MCQQEAEFLILLHVHCRDALRKGGATPEAVSPTN